MKKTITATLVGGAITAGALTGAGTASADYSWVADESASICTSLSLAKSGYGDFMNSTISLLQLTQDAGRAEVVSGIYQAAAGYCPEYLSYVPAR